jgi:hypothetical protein
LGIGRRGGVVGVEGREGVVAVGIEIGIVDVEVGLEARYGRGWLGGVEAMVGLEEFGEGFGEAGYETDSGEVVYVAVADVAVGLADEAADEANLWDFGLGIGDCGFVGHGGLLLGRGQGSGVRGQGSYGFEPQRHRGQEGSYGYEL